MAVEVEDLLEPAGPVNPDLFPDDDAPPAVGPGTLNDRLQTYLDRAAAKVQVVVGQVADVDRAVRAWALHLTYYAAYVIRLSKPSTDNLSAMGLTSETWSAEQIKGLKAQADAYAQDYQDEILAPATGSGGGAGQSMSTPTLPVW